MSVASSLLVCFKDPSSLSPGMVKDTDRPKVSISASERAAVEAMASKLPAWAKESGLHLQCVEGESKLTTVVRAFAHGMLKLEKENENTKSKKEKRITKKKHTKVTHKEQHIR